MCCLVVLSSIGESHWEWELQLAHSEILKMFQITRGPEGDLKYWVLCSWLLNRESSCDRIFETTSTPRWALWVRIVNLVAQSQSRRMIASSSNLRFDLWLQKSTSTDTLLLLLIYQPLIYAMDFYFNCSISPLFVRLVVVLRRFLKSNYEAPAPVLISEVPSSCHKLKSRNPQSYRLELISR